METINKLLKKQAPKLNRKAAALAANGEDGDNFQRPSSIMVRWTNNKDGSTVAVPREMLAGPTGQVFVKGRTGPPPLSSGKMVEEVS